jgi:hypothetical protein
MGDLIRGEPKPYSAGRQGTQISGAFAGAYPEIASTMRSQIPLDERALFDVRRELSPQEQELQAQLYETFAPRYTEAELANLRGAGGQVVRESEGLAREIDPEYYQTRARSSELLQELMQGGLTGGERTSIERGLRSSGVDRGLDNNPSGTEQFRHAIEYGGAARDRLGQALAMATQSLPSFRTTSGAQVQGQANQSLGNINNQLGNTNFGEQTRETGNQFLGSTTEAALQASQQRQDRKSINDETTQAVGSICCFIFLESYNGVLPWFVRKCRDDYYYKDPDLSKGYKRMAKFLVPLMQRFTLVRDIVNDLMIKPITCYGGYICSVSGFEHGKHNHKIMNFWLRVWKFLGKL